MLLSHGFTKTDGLSKEASKKGTFIEDEEHAILRGLLSQRGSSQKSFDLKNDNLSSIMGQDDPFLDNANLLQTDREFMPPTFREHTQSEKQSNRPIANNYFSLTDVNNGSSPTQTKDNSRVYPIISAMGCFQQSMAHSSGNSDSDFKLGTFANGLEAKHRSLVDGEMDDSEHNSYCEEADKAEEELMFQFRSVEEEDDE